MWWTWPRCAQRWNAGEASADRIEPLIPVDLVIDHSVQLDDAGNAASFKLNVDREFERNEERYKFSKVGATSL